MDRETCQHHEIYPDTSGVLFLLKSLEGTSAVGSMSPSPTACIRYRIKTRHFETQIGHGEYDFVLLYKFLSVVHLFEHLE